MITVRGRRQYSLRPAFRPDLVRNAHASLADARHNNESIDQETELKETADFRSMRRWSEVTVRCRSRSCHRSPAMDTLCKLPGHPSQRGKGGRQARRLQCRLMEAGDDRSEVTPLGG